MAEKRFYSDLRRKAKVANQRMRELEKRDINSPAYQSVQGKLEVLGKQKSGNRGRRFSESGRATYNEAEAISKILDEFLYDQKTSTLTGAQDYYDEVWESANANNKLSDLNISRDEWFDFWENMPNKEKERVLPSEQIVSIVQAYNYKNRTLSAEDRYTPEEIADIIQNKHGKKNRTFKGAYTDLGLTYSDIKAAKAVKLGAMK